MATLSLAVGQLYAANYDRSVYFGQPQYDANGNLTEVLENTSQTHNMDEFVYINVKNIKNKDGRVRIAMWDNKADYDNKENRRPFRACSHVASDNMNGTMTFKIGGLTPGQDYSFFAHHDENNDGIVNRNLFGVPKEPYVFTNTANQGCGTGLTREGLSAPCFESTLVTYKEAGQVITLLFN